ncbi:MAG TPA: low temperature requirement protein A, partial [Longimicrobium sp.]|nr:low temperature requirement protein A [Longimicrobium sp.]
WWMYGGYAWLTNHATPNSRSCRILLILAMGSFLVQALAIPHAFGEAGVAFGVAYLVAVGVHSALFWSTTRAIGRIAVFNVVSALMVIAAGVVEGEGLKHGLWVAAVAIQWISPYLGRVENFRIQPAHFVERHGLLIIVALGESVVAIGIGASGLALDAGLAAAAALGLALVACLWWTYFVGDDERAEAAMAAANIEARPALAIHAFFYAHIPMLLGIVCVAVGVKKALAHPTWALGTGPAVALGGGVALYLLGDVWFRRILRIGRGTTRAVLAAAALATIPLGTVAAALQLSTLVLLFVAAFVLEAARPEPAGAPSVAT